MVAGIVRRVLQTPAEKAETLMVAADKGNPGMVSCLLAAGANVETKNNKGMTALMLAAEHGYADVVNLLLESGAEVNTCNVNGGWTALMYAAHEGHVDVVKLILAKEANISVLLKNNADQNALMIAGQKGHKEVVALLQAASEKLDLCLSRPRRKTGSVSVRRVSFHKDSTSNKEKKKTKEPVVACKRTSVITDVRQTPKSAPKTEKTEHRSPSNISRSTDAEDKATSTNSSSRLSTVVARANRPKRKRTSERDTAKRIKGTRTSVTKELPRPPQPQKSRSNHKPHGCCAYVEGCYNKNKKSRVG